MKWILGDKVENKNSSETMNWNWLVSEAFTKSDHLSEREITELLKDPETNLQEFYEAVEVLDKASLKDSIAQALAIGKVQNDLGHVELFRNWMT